MNSTDVVSTILTPQTCDISLAGFNYFPIYLKQICLCTFFASFYIDQNHQYQEHDDADADADTDTDTDDDDDDMVMFRFSFTHAFDNNDRAAVFDAMLTLSRMSLFSSEHIHSHFLCFLFSTNCRSKSVECSLSNSTNSRSKLYISTRRAIRRTFQYKMLIHMLSCLALAYICWIPACAYYY